MVCTGVDGDEDSMVELFVSPCGGGADGDVDAEADLCGGGVGTVLLLLLLAGSTRPPSGGGGWDRRFFFFLTTGDSCFSNGGSAVVAVAVAVAVVVDMGGCSGTLGGLRSASSSNVCGVFVIVFLRRVGFAASVASPGTSRLCLWLWPLLGPSDGDLASVTGGGTVLWLVRRETLPEFWEAFDVWREMASLLLTAVDVVSPAQGFEEADSEDSSCDGF